MEIRLSPTAVGAWFIGSATVLTVLSLLVPGLSRLTGDTYLYGLVPLFNVGLESNIPTWYASATLLLCAGLLAFIAAARRRAGDRFARHWAVLAVIFAGLSLDEVATLHETLGDVLRLDVTGNTHGLFFYSWTIAGALFVVVVGLAYLNFLRQLPGRTRWLVLLAAAAYVGGALGLEMFNGTLNEAAGTTQTVAYALGTHIEEFMEMLGVALFAYALADYAAQHVGPVTLRFAADEPGG